MIGNLLNDKRKIINYIMQIVILIIIAIYFFTELKPIAKAALYSHSTTDDYWMSMYVYQVWTRTHSIFSAIAAAFEYAVGIYKTWDGNFLSMFLTSLSPLVFNESYYYVTFFIMIISLCAGIGLIGFSLLHKRWHIPFINCISIGLLFAIFFLNYLPNSGEGLYWWPGVANYTVFFGFILFAQGLFVLYWNSSKKIWLILASIAFFLVGLGNPLTGLINVCLLAYELIYIIYDKKSIKTLYWIPFVCALVALMIVVFSPASSIRVQDTNMNFFEIIMSCFKNGTILMKAITRPAVILYYIMVAVISFWSFYNYVSFDKKSFVLPGVFAVMMICLYYASYAPIIYAGGIYFGRLLDTNYFVMLMVFTVSIIYACGALACFIKKYIKSKKIYSVLSIVNYILTVIVVIICINLANQFYYSCLSTSFRVECSIKDDTLYEYDRILDERYQQLADPAIPEVYIYEPPYVGIYIHDDRSCYEAIGDYFKKSVIFVERK